VWCPPSFPQPSGGSIVFAYCIGPTLHLPQCGAGPPHQGAGGGRRPLACLTRLWAFDAVSSSTSTSGAGHGMVGASERNHWHSNSQASLRIIGSAAVDPFPFVFPLEYRLPRWLLFRRFALRVSLCISLEVPLAYNIVVHSLPFRLSRFFECGCSCRSRTWCYCKRMMHSPLQHMQHKPHSLSHPTVVWKRERWC
jgi:hypothetical protein